MSPRLFSLPVFMGSEKYPAENALDSFLSQNGGSSNAFTELEATTFEVSVLPEGLSGALDRWGTMVQYQVPA